MPNASPLYLTPRLWGAGRVASNEPSTYHDFVAAMAKGDSEGAGPWGSYTIGVGYPGNGMAPCGVGGCVPPAAATHQDCATKYAPTGGCALYVFAPEGCPGQAGPICWLKNAVGIQAPAASCRNSLVPFDPRRENCTNWDRLPGL